MQAPFEMSTGLERLKQIISDRPIDSPAWNEAENRFQFIDRLLTECLGWEKPSLRVEVSDDSGGKSDYLLGSPPKAILEAKREARHFADLPIGVPSRVRKLRPLVDSSKTLKDAVTQVAQYCVLNGAQIAVVCNGPQTIIFQALTPGYKPLDGECFFFNGFEEYINNFPILWTLLSPEGIAENRASRQLSLHRNPRIPPKASEAIPEPTKFRYRNPFQETLDELSSLLLEEIEDNPAFKSAFYEECYVPIEANNRHLLLSKNIISSRYSRAGDDGSTPAPLNASTRASDEGSLLLDDPSLTIGVGSRPVVVLGDVGVGKTSFFENLHESLDNTEKANTYFIHINLGVEGNLTSDIRSYVLTRIPEELNRVYGVDINSYDFIESIYHEQLRDFDNSPRGRLKQIDETEYQRQRIEFISGLTSRTGNHLRAALGHLSRGQNKTIVLILDNADQRSFDLQQRAFLIAQELADTRNLLVFVALRPSTFYTSKTTGALSGYQNRLLTISPPPADRVIEQRLTFAVRVAEGKVSPAALHGIRLNLKSVVTFLNAMLRSIRSNQEIQTFLSNITGGNTRSVIELVNSFCGSPNVDSGKIVEIEERSGNYKVPLHEFVKHALLGDYAYFNPQSSLVACNIFDTSTADPREHFLKSLIVAYANSNVAARDNDGYISGENIQLEMSKIGFLEEQIEHSLRRLASKRLIETPHAHFREIEVSDAESTRQFHFRVTSVGVYHLRFWTGAFNFLDATSIDTPIFDEEARSHISKCAPSFATSERYSKTNVFRRYLLQQWNEADIGVTYYNFPDLVDAGKQSFESVERFLNKHRSR